MIAVFVIAAAIGPVPVPKSETPKSLAELRDDAQDAEQRFNDMVARADRTINRYNELIQRYADRPERRAKYERSREKAIRIFGGILPMMKQRTDHLRKQLEAAERKSRSFAA